MSHSNKLILFAGFILIIVVYAMYVSLTPQPKASELVPAPQIKTQATLLSPEGSPSPSPEVTPTSSPSLTPIEYQ